MNQDRQNTFTENGVMEWYSGYRQMKLYLLDKFKICFWCKVKVKDYGNREEEQKIGIPDPDDMATIDHTKSRFLRIKGEVVEKVLACNKCNQERSRNKQ